MSGQGSARGSATQPSRGWLGRELARIWKQHCEAGSELLAPEVAPGVVAVVVGVAAAIIAAMAFIPAARAFTGLERPWGPLAAIAAAGASSLLVWRFWSRPLARHVLLVVDTFFYCLFMALVIVETSAPTCYLFGFIYCQAAIDWGRRSSFSWPLFLVISAMPMGFALSRWPDFGTITVVAFGAMMFPFTSNVTAEQRQLVRQNSRLRTAFQSADEVASRSMDVALAATVAEMGAFLHHLSNALTPAISNVRYLVDIDAIPGEDKAALDSANRSLERSAELVQKLLDTVKRRSEPLAGATFELKDALRESAQRLGAVVRLELPEELPPFRLKGNSEHLAIALENLVRNAAEAGSSRVDVVARYDDGGQRAVVSIADDGPGIPPELRPSLFHAPVTRGKAGGHGFGLYVSRRLVELLGGELRLAAQTGRGAAFELLLPGQQDVAGKAASPSRAASALGG